MDFEGFSCDAVATSFAGAGGARIGEVEIRNDFVGELMANSGKDDFLQCDVIVLGWVVAVEPPWADRFDDISGKVVETEEDVGVSEELGDVEMRFNVGQGQAGTEVHDDGMSGRSGFVARAGGNIEESLDIRKASSAVKGELSDDLVILVIDDEGMSMGAAEQV